MNTKIPPQNIEAEESVLGALMIDKNAIIRVADIVRSDDFYKPVHSIIFNAILGLYEKSEPIDLLTVTNELKEKNKLDTIGGSSYLTELIEKVPTASHIEHYAKLVKEKKILRNLIQASAEITESAFSPEEEIEDVLNNIEQKIFAISQHSISQKFLSIKHDLANSSERITKLHEHDGGLRGVATGFTEFDNLLSGFQRSDLIILGARPSMGKTSLALDFLRHAGVDLQLPVGMFSIEMSREQVIDRLISAVGAIPLWKLRTGKLNDEDLTRIPSALEKLSKAPIFIDDNPNPTILQMRAMARRLQAEHGLSMLVVDYLQLINARNPMASTVQQVTEISRGLKAIARELNVPVVALSQLSRATTQRDSKIPRLSDLRDSGSIEQDADVVIFIHRDDKDRNVTLEPQQEGHTEIFISKHRNGPTGDFKLHFNKEYSSFISIDKRHTQQHQ